MAIKNSVYKDLLSMFVDSINVFLLPYVDILFFLCLDKTLHKTAYSIIHKPYNFGKIGIFTQFHTVHMN